MLRTIIPFRVFGFLQTPSSTQTADIDVVLDDGSTVISSLKIFRPTISKMSKNLFRLFYFFQLILAFFSGQDSQLFPNLYLMKLVTNRCSSKLYFECVIGNKGK